MPDGRNGPGSDDPFTYGEITVPSLALAPRLTPDEIESADSPAAMVLTLMERSVSGEAMAHIETLTDEQCQDFIAAWGDHSGVGLAEIAGLLELDREHWEALEVDILRAGYHLRDLNWREIVLVVRHSPRESEYFRVTFGDVSQWGATEHLLASAVDALHTLTWLQSDTKKSKQPKPLPRPGQEPAKNEQTFGSAATAVRVEDFWSIWNSTEPLSDN